MVSNIHTLLETCRALPLLMAINIFAFLTELVASSIF